MSDSGVQDRALNRQTAAVAALVPARIITLGGVATHWVAFWAFLLSGHQASWALGLRWLGAFVAAWGCISLVVLCLVVFPEARTGLDGGVGLAAAVPGLTALIGTIPLDLHFASLFYFLSAGVALTVCGIFLAVLTLKTGSDQGGDHAHPQV
jgi:hypothetical protein